MSAVLSRVLDADYLAGLMARPLPEVREMRVECRRAEGALSYARRTVHGRVDLLTGSTQVDMSSTDEVLAAELAALLADDVRPAPSGRPPSWDDSLDLVDEVLEAIDAIAPPTLASSPLSEAEAEAVAARLLEHEKLLSGQRRQLHGTIDALQAEIARRYQSGEATVGDV